MCSVLNTVNDFRRILNLHNIQKVCLFIGNGPRLQYKDLDSVKNHVSRAIETTLNIKPEPEVTDCTSWLLLFGGDTFVEDKPDLGAVIHYVKRKYNPIVVSVQCWPEYDDHVDYVWKYPEVLNKGRIVYGGIDGKGNLLGGTSVYLSEDMRKLLTYVFNVDAQGRVGAQEKEFAISQKLNVVNIISI